MSETITLYKCSRCAQIITNPKRGLVFHGNVYIADPGNRESLVDDNFPGPGTHEYPGPDTPTPMTKDDVKETVLCFPCIMNTLLEEERQILTR